MGISVAGHQTPAPTLECPSDTKHSEQFYQELSEIADQIALTLDAVAQHDPLDAITKTRWSMDWERKLLDQSKKMIKGVDHFRPSLDRFCKALGVAYSDGSDDHFRNLHRLAETLIATSEEDFRTVFDPQLSELPEFLKDLDSAINAYDSAAASCGATFDEETLRRISVDWLEHDWKVACGSLWPLSLLRKHAVKKILQSYAKTGDVDPENALDCIRLMQRELEQIDSNSLSSRPHLWKHRQSDKPRIEKYLHSCVSLRELIHSVGRPHQSEPSQVEALVETLQPILSEPSSKHSIYLTAKEFIESYESFDKETGLFESLAGGKPYTAGSQCRLSQSVETANTIVANRIHLQRWTAWQAVRQRACEVGLEPLVLDCESGEIPTHEVSDRFRLAYVRWWLPGLIDSDDVLREFQRYQHENAIREFGDRDTKARESAADRVRKTVAHRLPKQSEVARKSELGLLRHQIGLKRPSKSIRELVSMMPEHFASLAPCLLMSPLSIAQYLPADQPPFDVVIFDEASQITTWDAIGAIARGRQTIIVGDPKQLPPTNFFGKVNDDEDEEDLEDYERDLESILDEAKASGLPTLQLNWHYRSRHESLIAFSNHHYYDDKLVTFPSPETTDSAVGLRFLPDSHYDRGKTRTNEIEARAIVAEATARMKHWLGMPEEQRKTLGVVTFNSQQQSLIQDLFDEAQRDDPTLEWFFSDDRIEPTVVKNLENVQGDERDLMLFSITFGPDASGKVPLTFGALNRDGGERRLNVAVTRAREELLVFSAFKANQLAAERSKSRGVQDLKHFLEFAENGAGCFSEHDADDEQQEGFGSPLEAAIGQRLKAKGWDVIPQVGVSGFRIALGIRHPSDKDTFLAGIECDGPSYRKSSTARDRDKTRQLVLGNLGWKILRVWSRDWWYDPDGAIERLDQELRRL
jgi:hypothetical protein